MTELKPCPFCGSKDVFVADDYSYIFGKGVRFVKCSECGGSVISNSKNDCLNDVIERWNKRVIISEVRQYGANPTNITNVGELNLNL